MKKIKLLLVIGVLSTILITSCKKDPVIPNEEEVITTMKFTLTPNGGGTPVVLTFQDIDGDGGKAPTITGGTLSANTTYAGSVELLNEIESPAEDITLEVKEEAEAHQFFYDTTVNGLAISYNDKDANGKPLGLSTVLKTSLASSGTIKVTLRHEPNKNGIGVGNGDITNAGGETDIEVTFDVKVQ